MFIGIFAKTLTISAKMFVKGQDVSLIKIVQII
jgi:hypothetical protein